MRFIRGFAPLISQSAPETRRARDRSAQGEDADLIAD
jgi:hypothetical protein